ncbi:MAG: hypothetical protein ACREBE_00070 [bacterium]
MKAAVDKLSSAKLQKLTQLAKWGVYRLNLAGEPVAPDEHEQIVHDAITDTMSRVVRWTRRTEIDQHLYDVILSRIKNGLRSAPKKVRVELEALDTDADPAAVRRRAGEIEAALARAQVIQKMYEVLFEQAAGDDPVHSLLGAYYCEVTDRREVMEETGLSLAEFVNARRRLDRLIEALPDELRQAALAAMRETGHLSGR